MDMPDVGGAAKKYWPYVLGGVVGLIIIVKLRGGGSAPATVTLPGYDSSANQAANALAAQSNFANAKLGADSAINWTLAQGTAAGQIGAAATSIITALQMPTINAINSGNLADASAIESASKVAVSGYQAQQNNNRGAALAVASFGDVVKASMGGISSAVQSVSGGSAKSTADANAKDSGSFWNGLGTIATML